MMRNTLVQIFSCGAAVGLLAFATGCQTGDSNSSTTSAQPAQPAQSTTQPAMASVAAPAARGASVVRVNAGAYGAYTNASGEVWQGDTGFEGGDVIERPGIEIANTQQPEIYRSEHYAMDSFTVNVPNGKYLAKLHFAETFEGIAGPGERVFSFKVQDREFKDCDVWAKAGGPNRAYVEQVPVEVTDGKFKITFTFIAENPQINGIELIPQ